MKIHLPGAVLSSSVIALTIFVLIQYSQPTDARVRTQFHEQGLHGPHSYRFGFDTGPGHNRMTRHEERDNHGNVQGYYTYYDPKGNLRAVYYEAHPKYGYRVKDFGHED